jgi:hypothetical protein
MPDAMKPPRKLNLDFPAVFASYTSVLWKSSVAAAFYADVAKHGARKAAKIATIHTLTFQNGPSMRRIQPVSLGRIRPIDSDFLCVLCGFLSDLSVQKLLTAKPAKKAANHLSWRTVM